MKFKDEEIEKLDLTNVDDIVRLISEFFCGEICYKQPCENDKKLLSDLLSNLKQKKFNFEQFNEFLLLLNQDRISIDFFKFLFGKEKISLHDLRKGIIKFRGVSLVCFGNFKTAYEQLAHKNKTDLEKVLAPLCRESESILHEFKKRLYPMLEIEPISRDETWYIGYISLFKYKKEKKYLEKSLFSGTKRKKTFLLWASQKYLKMSEIIKRVDKKALRNTNIYLTWDYMDVYIATSMRHKWEFQEVFDFTKEVFNDSNIKDLNLRYFDPTQSKCQDRIEKGLIEGLMLKRVLCSIYMAQESDTMGKDSELASTLAQGKPVIAYVPKIDIDKYSERIKKYPLDYFEKRLLILRAEGVFEDERCINELESYDKESFKRIEKFQKKLKKHRFTNHFSLLEEEEEKFKGKYTYFPKVCKILAIAEHHSFERRADTLREKHPLAIQVDLQSGVANGVLVVRHIKECADLLKRILTNSMEFTIKHIGERGKGITILEEIISKSPFRVVTDDEKLTNSFWNFYLNSQIK